MIWVLIVAGTILRLVLAFRYVGNAYDIGSLQRVAVALRHDPLHVYRTVNSKNPVGTWPYAPGFFPWTVVALSLSFHTSLPFHGWIKLPEIFADGAIAWILQDFLRRTGASDRARLVTVALVSLGPPFFVISGYHGQIDAVAVLPALLAVVLWAAPGTRRPVWCGLLIGIGAAIKTFPIFFLLALLPTARDWRERAALSLPAVAVPAVLLLPFAIADLGGLGELLRYQGLPGAGGFSLLLQPRLVESWLYAAHPAAPNQATLWMLHRGGLVTLGGLAVIFPVLMKRRLAPVPASVAVVVTIYAFSNAFFFQYLVWGLPFLLLAGYRRAVAVLSAVLILPLILFYRRLHTPLDIHAYQAVMAGVYVAFVLTWIAMFFRLVRKRPIPVGGHGGNDVEVG